MADKILHWHIPGVLSETGVVDTDVQGNAYQVDKDYRAVNTWLRVKRTCEGTGGIGIQIDINDDGTSIYGEGQEPVLPQGTQDTFSNTFSSTGLVIQEGSVVTLDIDQVGNIGPGNDLVVELYLEKV